MSIATKYNPGVYTFTAPFRTDTTWIDVVTEDGTFLGAQKVYTWRELETSEGVYDFTPITDDLATLQAAGKRLWPQITDVWFVDGAAYYPCPDYIISYGGQLELSETGYIAKRWDTYVTDSWNNMITALGAAIDGEAYIEGANIPESSISLSDESCENYALDFTHEVYYDKMASRIDTFAAAFPTTNVVQYVTHWPNCVLARHYYVQKLRSYAILNDVGMGGPDMITNNKFINPTLFENLRKIRGIYPLGGAVQFSNWRQGFNATEILKTCFEKRFLDYAFLRYQDADPVRGEIGKYIMPPRLVPATVAVAGMVDVRMVCGTPGSTVYYNDDFFPELPDNTSTEVTSSPVSITNGHYINAVAYVGTRKSAYTRVRVAV